MSENEHGSDDPPHDADGAHGPAGSQESQESIDGDELPVDFKIFVLSLNASALIHLGETTGASVSLPMARHTIDILCMLEEKTRGNLTGEEARLLHQVLFDLRMLYTRKATG